MERLIPIINRLQDVFNTVGQGADVIQLPQIVVIGTQSSGKSSVLENLVGKDFLPRGTGIVTRCPLVLQLVHTTEESTGELWGWAEFQHQERKRYEDLTEVREEIRMETEKIAGANKGISTEAIRLRIHSSHVLDLTLVDLPGITKVPVGEQPEDIEQQTYSLCRKYIKNPNSIILAVTPANIDIATSEALKLAKSVDPQGDRTLAVCTKLDLMDRGTDAHDILEGKVIPVKLGIIGVINRSQEDIQNKKSIEEALKFEGSFLKKRYPLLAVKSGTPYLGLKLNKLLMSHIRRCLPDLRARVNSMINKHEMVLNQLGQPITNRGSALLQVLTGFATEYVSTIEGTSKDIETDRLSGGARICYIFHDLFKKTVAKVEPLQGLSKDDVTHAITNAMGPRPALFVPEMAFELLVKRQIRLLLSPSLQCAEKVYEEMKRVMQYCVQHLKEFQRFPSLKEEIVRVVSNFIKQRLPVANSMVEDLIQIELAYINTNHPDFIGGKHAAYESILAFKHQQIREETSKAKLEVATIREEEATAKEEAAVHREGQSRGWSWWPKREKSFHDSSNVDDPPTPQDTEVDNSGDSLYVTQEVDCQLIENLISSYFVIVRKTIQDAVPKAIMHCLVNFVKENLQSELVRLLYKNEVMDQLMTESPEIFRRRKETAEMLEALQKANDILSEIRDIGMDEFF